jgi:hypothetical protein
MTNRTEQNSILNLLVKWTQIQCPMYTSTHKKFHLYYVMHRGIHVLGPQDGITP